MDQTGEGFDLTKERQENRTDSGADETEAERDSLAALELELPELASLPPGADDEDVVGLSALARTSRAHAPAGAGEPAVDASAQKGQDDDGRLDLSEVAGHGTGADAAGSASAAVHTAAPGSSPAHPRSGPRERSGQPGWLLGAALGVLCGVGAGWALFGNATGPLPAVAETVAEAPPKPVDKPADATRVKSSQASQPEGSSTDGTQPVTPASSTPGSGDARADGSASGPGNAPGVHAASRAARAAASPTKKTDSPDRGKPVQSAALPAAAAGKKAPDQPPVAGSDKQPAAAAKREPSAAAPRSVDRLLDEALSAPNPDAELERARDAQRLPQTPGRDDLMGAMKVLLPAIRGCAMGQTGLANISLVIGGDGKVQSALVAGAPFAGTSAGRCMEGVARRARFPRFRQPSFRVRIPLALQ